MPTYAYECSNCGNQFELVQKFADDPITRCPRCKKNKVRRVIQASPVVFKGSGWYITDHRSNSKKSTTSSSSSHSDSSSSADSGSNGDKSAEKADKAVEKAATSEKADKPARSESKAAKSESSSSKSSND